MAQTGSPEADAANACCRIDWGRQSQTEAMVTAIRVRPSCKCFSNVAPFRPVPILKHKIVVHIPAGAGSDRILANPQLDQRAIRPTSIAPSPRRRPLLLMCSGSVRKTLRSAGSAAKGSEEGPHQTRLFRPSQARHHTSANSRPHSSASSASIGGGQRSHSMVRSSSNPGCPRNRSTRCKKS